jgi:hypothetical protein
MVVIGAALVSCRRAVSLPPSTGHGDTSLRDTFCDCASTEGCETWYSKDRFGFLAERWSNPASEKSLIRGRPTKSDRIMCR